MFRRTASDSRIPNGSLLTLRTFYAFGARSGLTPFLQRSSAYNAHSSNLYTVPLQQPTLKSIRIQRSSTGSSIYSKKYVITHHNRNYFPPSSNIFNPYSSAIVNIHKFSINTRSSYQIKNDANLQFWQEPANVDALEVTDEASKSLDNLPEMIALIEKNKSLETEVKRLALKLKDKESSEMELRKKILEYAAEIKVWKKKYEMQKRITAVEMSESECNDEEINDIMEQLNKIVEKLNRFDAVKDLKLLQSEMETALKEISN